MKARGLEFPADRSPAEGKAKVTKPKAAKAADGVKKPRGRKPKAPVAANVEEENQALGEEGEEVQDDDAEGEIDQDEST
jgi:hypothetical protein